MRGNIKGTFLAFNLIILLSMGMMNCTGGGDDDDDNDSDLARWTFLIWMNGDNNLEAYVTHDMNELEQVGSGNGIHVVVQADRIEGYSTDDGDWTGTRRYYITWDDDLQTVTSPVIEDLGEVDMGDPLALSDFLIWSHTTYPAEKYVLIFWDHGDGWSASPAFPALIPLVSYDETSGNYLGIARGDIRVALTEIVSLRGQLEVIGFDACNMACWEVAHSLRDQALTMAGSEAWVGGEGYMYAPVLELMHAELEVTAVEVADELSRASVQDGNELTHSAINLAGMDDLAVAIDTLAGTVLDSPELEATLLEVRQNTRGADDYWKDWYLDLKDFAALLEVSAQPSLAACGSDIRVALDETMISCYGNPPYDWTGGLSIFFDLEWPNYLNLYHSGDGATWSAETRWDDLLLVLAEHNAIK